MGASIMSDVGPFTNWGEVTSVGTIIGGRNGCWGGVMMITGGGVGVGGSL